MKINSVSKARRSNSPNVDYTLYLNSDQAHETLKAVELLMRLKLNQYEQIPYNLLDLADKEYCDKRDEAKPLLEQAFKALFKGKRDDEWKDDEWYRLYNLYQVIRKAIHDAEHPSSTGVDANDPIRFTDEPLPKCDFTINDNN